MLSFVPDECDLPSGVAVAHDLTDSEIEALVLDCKYANPATDRATILSCMSKTAAPRQQWIRNEKPSITEVLEKYPRLEDVPLDLVFISFKLCDTL